MSVLRERLNKNRLQYHKEAKDLHEGSSCKCGEVGTAMACSHIAKGERGTSFHQAYGGFYCDTCYERRNPLLSEDGEGMYLEMSPICRGCISTYFEAVLESHASLDDTPLRWFGEWAEYVQELQMEHWSQAEHEEMEAAIRKRILGELVTELQAKTQ